VITLPGQLLTLVVLGLLSVAIFCGALYLLYRAFRPRVVYVPAPETAEVHTSSPKVLLPEQRENPRKKLMIAIAVLMLAFVFAGKYLVAPFYAHAQKEAAHERFSSATVRGASGAELAISTAGAAASPTLVLTHGWGADRRAWQYAATELGKQYRVVLWDLPGLGASSPTGNGDYSMATLAADLNSVVETVRGPVVLVGHIIGGIMNKEYSRR
jgi:hypothetical protein